MAACLLPRAHCFRSSPGTSAPHDVASELPTLTPCACGTTDTAADTMQRTAGGSPCRGRERGLFRRSVSRDGEARSPGKADAGKDKMVKNIYRRPISRAKDSLANRSVFGENRRQQFTRCHLNQVWSSDPRDFRSHATGSRSHESDSSDHGLPDPHRPPGFSRARRSSSVPDVQFVAPPGNQQGSSDEEGDEARVLSRSAPSRQAVLRERPDSGGRERRRLAASRVGRPMQLADPAVEESGDGARSPLLRQLYHRSRHLSHEVEERGGEHVHSGSLDTAQLSRAFSAQLSLDGTKAPEDCKTKPNVMLRSCDFELYDLEPETGRGAGGKGRRGLRVLIHLQEAFAGTKTTVKALSGGRTLKIVASSPRSPGPGPTSPGSPGPASPGPNEAEQRIDLPVTVDPFSVKARTARCGQLCIEAPVRHQ